MKKLISAVVNVSVILLQFYGTTASAQFSVQGESDITWEFRVSPWTKFSQQ